MDEYTKTLLRRSAADRGALEYPLDPAVLGFHAQQACEKLLKALLHERLVDFPFTHNLVLLAELVARHDETLPNLPLELASLNEFAVTFRYEGWPESRPPVDPVTLRETVDALRAHVQTRLNARPGG